MTDAQAQQRAERLVEKLNKLRADIQGGYETTDSPVSLIAAELLAVQRETREADCRAACMYCNDPAWAPADNGRHQSSITGTFFPCRAVSIREGQHE